MYTNNNAKITWKTKINVPAAIPPAVVEKLIVLRDFMSDPSGEVSKAFAKNEAAIANRLCIAAKKNAFALDKEFKSVLDEYVYKN